MPCANKNFRCRSFVSTSLDLPGLNLSISTLHSSNTEEVCYSDIVNDL